MRHRGKNRRILRTETLEIRRCLAASLGWDGPGQGSAELTYYIGAEPSGLSQATVESAIETALGAVRYELEGLSPLGAPTAESTIVAAAKSGVAQGISSRAEAGAPLKGTKRSLVNTPRVWLGHGRRDGRRELNQAIAALGKATETPGRLVVVVDLRQSPDRGVGAVLAALRTAAQGRLVLLLTGAAALHRRLVEPDVSARIADWVAAGLNAGIDTADMVAIDLDRRADDLELVCGYNYVVPFAAWRSDFERVLATA